MLHFIFLVKIVGGHRIIQYFRDGWLEIQTFVVSAAKKAAVAAPAAAAPAAVSAPTAALPVIAAIR
jgi:hypothetical protein